MAGTVAAGTAMAAAIAATARSGMAARTVVARFRRPSRARSRAGTAIAATMAGATGTVTAIAAASGTVATRTGTIATATGTGTTTTAPAMAGIAAAGTATTATAGTTIAAGTAMTVAYDWHGYRGSNRGIYRLPRYYAPSGWGYGYRRFGIGFTLNSILFSSQYWINDPYYYRLPEAYGPYRWVRYYNDALLVDVETGEVVDTIYDIFW
jgi:Ni/Co efflux regulator RcnB